MLNDPLANALSKILNAEKLGKSSCIVKPSSKVIKKVFEILQDNHFIGEFEEIKDGKGNKIKVELIGKINGCGAIKPRFPAKRDEFEKFEKRYLPAKNFGILMVSTPEGIMIQDSAEKKDIGGVMLAYCY